MITFVPEIAKLAYFSSSDKILFHFLPQIKYFCGVYETSARAFARQTGFNERIVSNFFYRLSKSGFVQILKYTRRGKFAGISFCRKESNQFNLQFLDTSVYYVKQNNIIAFPRTSILPKNFFKSPPKKEILAQLLPYLQREDYYGMSVRSILESRILTRNPRRESSVTVKFSKISKM